MPIKNGNEVNKPYTYLNSPQTGEAISIVSQIPIHGKNGIIPTHLYFFTKQTVKIEYVAYVGNLDSYLENQKVLALYNSGKKSKAKQEAFSNLESQNKYSFSLDAYVSCLGDDKAKLSALADEVFENKTILEHIDERISLLEYSSLGKIDQVMSVYTLLKVNKIKYQLLVAQDKTEQANAVQAEISRLQNEYTSLIAE